MLCAIARARNSAGCPTYSAAIAFGLKVLKHRFSYGIEDPSVCSIRVSNEIGRVLTTIPLEKIKRLARHA